MTYLALIPIAIGMFSAGFSVGRMTRRTENQVRLREHARLIGLADRAHRHERYGLAQIYTESAERVMKDLDS